MQNEPSKPTLTPTIPAQPQKKSKAKFILLAIILICLAVLICGGIVFFVIRSRQSTLNQAVTPTTTRVSGNATINSDSEVSAPTFTDLAVSKDFGNAGGVISLESKKGYKAYFIAPENSLPDNNVDMSEFQEMPMSKTHVPLYTDFGFGLNISITNIHFHLQNPVYLVFDFSKGERAKAFEKMTKYSNFCNYTKRTFVPEVCAALLNIPADKTLNKNYVAVAPEYAGDGRTPSFATYSYYIADDLLVVKLINSAVVIPQPLSPELALDLVKSTFGGYTNYDSEIEAYDLARNLNLSFTDKTLIDEMNTEFQQLDFKTLASNEYINSAYDQAVQKGILEPGGTTKPNDLFKSFNPDKSIAEVIFENHLVGADADLRTIVKIANIRRAYDSKVAGSAKVALESLKDIEQNIKEDTFDQFEYPYAFLAEGIILGEGKYTSQNVKGADSDAQDVADFEKEVANAIESFKKQLQDFISKNINPPADSSDECSGASDALRSVLQMLQLADMVGDESSQASLEDALKNAARNLMKCAETDDEILKADKACQLILDDNECDPIHEKAKKVMFEMCQVQIKAKNLSNFAQQDEVTCRQFIYGDD